jgi:tartrate/fumarate subfamily iron-sulfur-dependent hydro-lyase beta chain
MRLDAPFTEEKIRELKVGDIVELTGVVFTGRDAVHKYLHDGNDSPVDLRDGIIYHCGPVVVKENGVWVVKAAGPTTSIREEPYQASLIERFHIRGVIGKGGMGANTLAACQGHGCAYLHAIGGAAQVLAERVTRVNNVYLMEKFGSPEAIWEFQVEAFPVVVTMDAHGNSLHKDLLAATTEKLKEIFAEIDRAKA